MENRKELTEAERLSISRLRNKGQSFKKIAERFNISKEHLIMLVKSYDYELDNRK